MKRIFSLGLAFLLGFCITACSGPESQPDTTETGKDGESLSEPLEEETAPETPEDLRAEGEALLAELKNWDKQYYALGTFLSYTQYDAALRPMVDPLTELMEQFPEEAARYGEALEKVYYMLGEMDNVLALRRTLYELTGEDRFSPDGYTAQGELGEEHYDGYGQRVQAVVGIKDTDGGYSQTANAVYEYNDRGKVVKMTADYTDAPVEMTYVFDDEGHITSWVIHQMGEIEQYNRSNYEYDGSIVHNHYEYENISWDINSSGEEVYEIDQYGNIVSTQYYDADGNLIEDAGDGEE